MSAQEQLTGSKTIALQRLRGDRVVAALAQSLLIVVWPVFVVSATYRFVAKVLAISPSRFGLILSLSLFAAATLALAWIPPRVTLVTTPAKSIAFQFIGGFAAFELLLWVGTVTPVWSFFEGPFLLFFAAGVEEVVFRVFLPYQLMRRLHLYDFNERDALIIACIASQCAFALCHFFVGHGLLFAIPLTEFARLFAAGLLYAEIVAVVGVGVAAAIHACTNVLLRTSAAAPIHVGLSIICVFALLGLVQLWFRAGSKDQSFAAPD